jgi:hypothetical protein
MEKVDFLFKYPTRSRQQIFLQNFNKYANLLSGKHPYKFLVSLDNDDPTMNNIKIRNFLKAQKNTIFYFGNSKSKVEAINADMDKIKDVIDFSILLLISDDMVPKVRGYDHIIYSNMIQHFPNFDGVLYFNDGNAGPALNTLSIMGKKVYDHFGYIYHPSYISLWCDNEYDEVTKAMGKSVYVDQVIIKHEWIGLRGDDLHRKNETFFERDHNNFLARKAKGFPK